ncbi:DUF4190 domain-containing protein [Bacillus sp. FSL K6-3431]|uniref:DUF4190 domain-containing protein n=1 Tax=Bacillus sp. FSL K6-3431 TaxID=2921500 RepID=UPI0030FA66C8
MEKTNSKSVAALTLGVLSLIIPFIGLILGVIGIVLSSKSITEIDNSNEIGRGLAISGKVCSIVGICLQIIMILFVILSFVLFNTTTFELQ